MNSRLILTCALAIGCGWPVELIAQPVTSANLRPFLEVHCLSCHNGESKKGGLDLTESIDLTKPEQLARWTRLHDRVEKGEMPPGKRKPDTQEKSQFLALLARGLIDAEKDRKSTVLRRLNRLEYENTLHDMLGIRVKLADMLPEDGKAHGFDNVGEALDLSGAQLQRYLDAADVALTAATRKTTRPELKTSVLSFSTGRNTDFIGKYWHKLPDGTVVFFNDGRFPQISPSDWKADFDGRYRIKLKGYAYQKNEPVTLALYITARFLDVNSRCVGYFALPPGQPSEIEVTVEMFRGETIRLLPHGLGGAGPVTKVGPAKYPGAGLAIQSMEIVGPILEEWPGRGHRLLFGDLVAEGGMGKGSKAVPATIRSKSPEADAERLLKQFVEVAFRRPVPPQRVAPYVKLAKAELAAGVPFEEAMRTAYKAVLCSPHFLYLLESPGKLDDYALAARLSYFFWRSAPDSTLLALAQKGVLSRPEIVRQQMTRLLKDPRAERFVSDFVGQWLNLRDLEATTPDEKLYPEYDDSLLFAMKQETELFFREMLMNNRPLTEFIHSDWTMLNERLAKHYGIPGVKGPEFRKVPLKPEYHRGGVLTQASVLKVSANGTTTSPVTRGAWVLERLLGEPPPPPPPGIPGVEPDIRGATTIRQQLDKHRDLASCAACHKVIDPPGFALERYDVVGGWRERYRVVGQAKSSADTLMVGNRRVTLGPKVDASGEMADGQKFAGPDEFKRILLKQPDRVAHALADKLAVFGTGRVMGFSDRAAIHALVKANAQSGRGLRDLIERLVLSELFQTK